MHALTFTAKLTKDSLKVFFLHSPVSACVSVHMEYRPPPAHVVEAKIGFRSCALQFAPKLQRSNKRFLLIRRSRARSPCMSLVILFGGALASLFYSRLRKGHDLDDVCDVRDAYVYGCPGVGDTDFAMGYARSLLTQPTL